MAPKGACRQVGICLTIFSVLTLLQSDNVLTKNPDHNADDAIDASEGENVYGLPGIQFEYRFEVGAGTQQCFFQKLRQDCQLHVAFEVRT